MKVLFEKKGPVAYVTINRRALNAATSKRMGCSRISVRVSRRRSAAVAILTESAIGHFGAGSDIKDNYVAHPGEEAPKSPFTIMYDLYKPMNCRHHGHAMRRPRTGVGVRHPGRCLIMRSLASAKCDWDGCRAVAERSDCRG